MASRGAIIVDVAVILMLAGVSLPLLPASFAQSSSNPTSSLNLGYGPSALRPITDGIPVYTIGDQMWVLSDLNSTVLVTLVPSSTIIAPFSASLSPGIPTPLYSFAQGSPEGTWSLEVQTNSGSAFNVPVQLIEPGTHHVQPQINSSLLQRSTLITSFTANLSDAYDIQPCFTSSQSSRTVSLVFPASIGTGSLAIQRNGSALVFAVNGSVSSPFTFWFEVYHPYSYAIQGTGELISRDVKSAESTPVLLQSQGRTNTTLIYDTHLRSGRSTIRAFFDNAKGLVVEETSLLIPDGASFIPLGSCGVAQVRSQAFAYTTNLTQPPATWPNNLYLMYRMSGVEAVTTVPVRLNVSRISFVALPWGVPLSSGLILSNESGLASGVTRLPSIQLSPFEGSLYLVSDSYPATIGYTVTFFGHARTITQTIAASYTVNLVPLDSAKLNVKVLNGSRPAPNVQVRLTYGDSNTSVPTGGDGVATFFVPEGNYTATASVANQSQAKDVRVINGNQTSVSMIFTVGAADSISTYYLEVGLVITAAVGVLANIVLVFVFRRRRPQLIPVPLG